MPTEMINIRKKLLAKGTRVLDLVVMVVSFVGAIYMAAPRQTLQALQGLFYLQVKLRDLLIILLVTVAWNRLFAFFGLYEVRRLGNRFQEWGDIFKAVTSGVIFFAAVGYFFSERRIDNSVFLHFWFFSLALSVFARTLVREGLVWLRKSGRNLRDIIIVGVGPRAVDLAQRLLSRPELGYRLLGFVDGVARKDPLFSGKVVCDLDELPNYLEQHIVDEVFIVLPIKSHYDEILQIAQVCEDLGIVCRIPSDWFNLKTARTSAYEVDGIPILTLYTGSKHQLESLWLKRLIDIFLSAVALIVLAPVFLFIGFLVKVTSKGPVFFKQDRVGYNRRPFKIYKFRTMVPDAERLQPQLEHLNEADGPTFKIYNDPRITPVGRWLRKTSLDEIPQLWNVLRGEMSLVGPRPLPLRDVQGIDKRWQKRRFSMRPGLTCLWQINGRNHRAFHEWMLLDLKYIDEWSIKLDFKIMLKTIPALLKATGH